MLANPSMVCARVGKCERVGMCGVPASVRNTGCTRVYSNRRLSSLDYLGGLGLLEVLKNAREEYHDLLVLFLCECAMTRLWDFDVEELRQILTNSFVETCAHMCTCSYPMARVQYTRGLRPKNGGQTRVTHTKNNAQV